MSNPDRYVDHMTINHRSSTQPTGRLVQKFGEASLFRRPDGKHELVGGTTEDIATANDWASLIAHEVVFSQPNWKRRVVIAPKIKPLVIRLYPGRTGCG